MSPPATNTLDDLERQRLELEDNILKLQESLYHWRLWEAEYDGLKEELDYLNDGATKEDFLQAARDFGGKLVNEEEVKVLLGDKQGVSRTRQQIIDIISRRVDYVRQNVATMEKRLRAVEDKLNALDGDSDLATAREHKGTATATNATEDGKDFPVTEIVEELDEEGNVISSSASMPGDHAPELLEILKKVGVKDIPDVPAKEKETAEQKAKAEGDESGVKNLSDTPAKEPGATKQPANAPQPAKIESKAEDTSQRPEKKQEKAVVSEPQEAHVRADSSTSASQEVNGTSEEHLESHTSAAVEQSADDQEEFPVTEVDESPEDAKLRREMLQYGLNEVGAVVAELELDEDASEVSIEDEYEYEHNSEDNEEEDEFGRSVRPVLSEEYHQQMRELEKKLNARGMWNVGKDTHTLPEDVRNELEKPGVVKIDKTAEDTITEETVPEKKPKKKVAFAEELDIAPALKAPAPEKKELAPRQPDVPVVSDSIVERTERVAEKDHTKAAAPKKVSRFKSARNGGNNADDDSSIPAPPVNPSRPSQFRSSIREQDSLTSPSSLPLFPAKPKEPKPFSQPIRDITEEQQQTALRSAPQPPEGKTLADKLFEREIPEGSPLPPEPDELDEKLHRKEIATEFYRMRNRMIQQKGGFVNDEEPETVPVETDESTKRVSRFKAARMR